MNGSIEHTDGTLKSNSVQADIHAGTGADYRIVDCRDALVLVECHGQRGAGFQTRSGQQTQFGYESQSSLISDYDAPKCTVVSENKNQP
ncbi:hypothetical protein BZP36_18915 [Raoultella terrigena]|nr:hypothetical protein BZP36_18915 [Raoultella terrigena]